MNRIFYGILALIIFSVPLVASAAGHSHDHSGGKAVYDEHCAHCHGYEGDGQGYAFENAFPKPRDFTFGMFKIRTTATGEEPTQDDLFNIISRGMPGTTMPEWATVLNEQQRRDVAVYVEQFYKGEDEEEEDEEVDEDETEKEEADEEETDEEEADEEEEEVDDEDEEDAPVAPLVIPKAPVSTPESIALGKELTIKVECDKCHGKEGRADGPSAMELKDDWNQLAMRPADWTAPWRFRGGNLPEDIFRTVRTGLNGTAMPSFAEDLTDEETWNVVHYVRSLAPEVEPNVKRTLVSKEVEGELSLEMDVQWQAAQEFYVPFSGQVIVNERLFQPMVHSLRFRSIYNEEEIAFRIQWNDPTSKDHKDFAGGDEMILQFPAKLKKGERIKPYFLMGQPGKSVNIWLWSDATGKAVDAKSSRLGDWLVREDHNLDSKIEHKNGQYTLSIKRARVNEQKGSIQFPPDQVFVPIAFSVVEGSSGEGGSKRGVTTWYNLLLEQPVGNNIYYVPILIFLLILGLEILLMIRTRKNFKAAKS
ncbi:MAG: c-type cytochrome [SAR324 cluster bacterium]|nr:c-type cytochrome [SAR324 cluster bacterium]